MAEARDITTSYVIQNSNSLAYYSQREGYIESTDGDYQITVDDDWYKIYVRKPSNLQLLLTMADYASLNLYLYDQEGDWLSYTTSNIPGTPKYIFYQIPSADYYYVQIRPRVYSYPENLSSEKETKGLL